MADLQNLIPAKQIGSYNKQLRLRRAGFLHPIVIDGRLFYAREEVDTLATRLAAASERLLMAGGVGRRGRPGYTDLAGGGMMRKSMMPRVG